MKRTNIMALVAASALVLGALAVPVAAQETESERSDVRAEKHDDRREKLQEKRDAARDKYEERQENQDEKHKAYKALRAHKALQGAIQALEHRIVKLEFMEHRIKDAIEDQNATDVNQTELEKKLERVEAAQERMLDRLKHLYEKQQALRERWHDHVHGDDGDARVDDDEDVDDVDDDDKPSTSAAADGNATAEDA